MRNTELTRWLARSRLAPVAALPTRLRAVARHDGRVLRESLRWLVTSREHHNYTYDLTPRNREHLAWFVTAVTGAAVTAVRGWLDEVEGDTDLRAHLERGLATSPRRRLADPVVRYGRRVGWYAIVRALRPAHLVETGVDKGLGSCVLAAALLRNAAEGSVGRLTGLDVNPDSGYLVTGPYAEVFDLVLGDSLATIPQLVTPVDLFLHDSWHSEEHEAAEFRLAEDRLAPGALLMTDNASETDVLVRHAEATGRRFLFFDEVPARHWFPGDGTGVAWSER